jgi:hypothetical protein
MHDGHAEALSMSANLDHLIERLAAAPADRSLHELEAEIALGISRRRVEARTARRLAPFEAAAIGLAMVLGLTVGAMTAAAAPARHADAFAVTPELAPSTLLEGGR